MTSLTLTSVLADVHVVVAMARRAFHREFDLVRRLFVATGASDFAVCAAQCEAGFLCVVEVPNVPAVRRVAIGALLAKSAFVDIVAGMAAVTVGWGALVSFAGVAIRARHCHV